MDSMEKRLYFSKDFVISCGTVSVDIVMSKVLIILWRKTNEHFLPKGRKNLNEALERTALRETFEETGMRVELLPVNVDTQATLPSCFESKDRLRAPVTEPIALSQRVTNGVLKIIFWYVAVADSTTAPEQGTQQENEDFDTVWADFDDVDSILSFDDDRRIAQEAIAAVRRGVAPVP